MKFLEVYIWDKKVGVLARTDQGISFEYTSEFKQSGLELSPLQLPLNGKKVFINESEWKACNGIPGVIYDSLPDRFGNQLLDTFFQEKGLSQNDIDVFSKLQFVGDRGMGALEYRPPMEEKSTENRSISLQEIKALSDLGTQQKMALNTNIKSASALIDIIHIGTSAGGARAKALIAINEKTGEIRSGQIKQSKDYRYYLIKIDGANTNGLSEPSGYGKLEYSYYQMAKDSGINMMESYLYQNIHFITKRFDRSDFGDKIHTHSLCAIAGFDYHKVGEYAYEQYFMVGRKLALGLDDLEEMYKRMVFNVLAHNCDDHTKNFSFTMNQQGKWLLSPAFDVCYSYDSGNEWVSGHNMTINGKRKSITLNDLELVGKQFNIKSRNAIVQRIQSVVNNFKTYALHNSVHQTLIEEVEKNRPKI